MTHAPHRAPDAEQSMDQVSCAAVLWAISVETHRVADLCNRLEDLVGRLVEHCDGAEKQLVVEEAQMVDALQQQVVALASFAETAAKHACDDAKVDIGPALAAVPMTTLARRLEALLQRGEAPVLADVTAGDLDLF
jgi:hypothetical protein